MNKNINALGLAIAATLGAGTADASTYSATLVSVASFSSSGSSSGNISSSTATWSYDDVTGLLTQTGGTFNVRYVIVPTTTLFRHSITGLVIGNGGAATASTYVCAEGNFGSNVAANLCGNFNFGANFINEGSSVSYGPGTSWSRTLGGDDMALGPAQNISAYDGFTTVSWVGTTLVLNNVSGGFPTTGYQFTLNAGLQAVPVPAAAWLFGGALLGLGGLRRQIPRQQTW